jgi:hypothetical protein
MSPQDLVVSDVPIVTNPEVIVFYADQIHWMFKSEREFLDKRHLFFLFDAEIYNGAYVWFRKDLHDMWFREYFRDKHWFRMDLSSVPVEDVPKAARLWALIYS